MGEGFKPKISADYLDLRQKKQAKNQRTASPEPLHFGTYVDHYYGEQINRMRWVGHVAHTEETKKVFKIFWPRTCMLQTL
jgi:hypothetical protein